MKYFLLPMVMITATAFGGFKKDYLQAHNHFRTVRGFEDMQWSNKLQNAAQEQADKCTTAYSGTGYGENVWLKGGVEAPAIQVVHSWKPKSQYTNFYQSTWLGCATASCGGRTSIVCNYYPGAWGN